jgi:hypothetical protein
MEISFYMGKLVLEPSQRTDLKGKKYFKKHDESTIRTELPQAVS